jgi:hypothetical protein
MEDRFPRNKIERVCSNGRWLRRFQEEYECETCNTASFEKREVDFVAGETFKLLYPDNIFITG